jgi:hypothetical protein
VVGLALIRTIEGLSDYRLHFLNQRFELLPGLLCLAMVRRGQCARCMPDGGVKKGARRKLTDNRGSD